jgi:tetratricopeptide (TPR) repeat protein
MTDTAEKRWESHNESGRRLFSQGDHAAAEQEFVAAIREATSLGADNVRLASSLSSLGQIKYRQKDLQQAEALFRRALAIRERVLGSDHFSLVQAINNLATLHYSRGELDQAARYFTRALEICDKNLGEKHPDVAVTLNNLARLHFRRNDFVAAAPLLMRLLAIKQEAVGAHHPEVAVILTSLAKVRLAEGQHEDAEQLARRALLIREEIHQAGDPAITTSLETLADVMAARGQLEDEQRLRRRVAEIRSGSSAQPRSFEEGDASPSLLTPVPAMDPAVGPASALAAADAEIHEAKVPEPARADAMASSSEHGLTSGSHTPPERVAAAAASGTQRVEQIEAPRQERTTRSASLPWIEPPTSPALRRPNARPITAPRPEGKSATPLPEARDSAAAHRRAPLRHDSTAAPSRQSSPVAGPISAGPPRLRREVVLNTPDTPPARSWLKVATAAVVLLGAGAGGWVYLAGKGEWLTSTASSALDRAVGEPPSSNSSEPVASTNGGDPRASSGAPPEVAAAAPKAGALTASADPAYGANPPVREAPPVAAYGDDNQSATPRSAPPEPSTAPSALHAADAGEMAATPAEPTPDLSRINVDKITTAIGANAKARADSLGRKTITVKPPDFDKPRP